MIENNQALDTEHKTIKMPNKLQITAVYIKGGNLDCDELDELQNDDKTILIGDFNVRLSDWNNEIENNNGFRLKRLIEQTHCLLYYPDETTRYS